jgi:pre-rRNA-processing protein TSR3
LNIYIIDLDQDDPKKCTGKRLIKFGFAKRSHRPIGIVLNPVSSIVLSIKDKEIILNIGLTVIDSSWNKSDMEFFNKFKNRFSRRLPFLLAGNPINYSKPFKLSSIEAAAAALYIIGEEEIAVEILNKIKWGHTFLELNNELLKSYEGKSDLEILQLESEFLREPQK